MEKNMSPAAPLYERANDVLWYRHKGRLYEIGTYKLGPEIIFTPYFGNVVLYFHQKEFNMITLNNLSLISLFSEAYNYKLTQSFHMTRPSNITDILHEYHLDCDGCNYVIVYLNNADYYIFVFDKNE